MKKFIGITYLLYVVLIIYVWSKDLLKNFLAPNMQIYLIIAIIPLIVIGIICIFNKHIHYHFKLTDLVLLLPLIMIFFTGNGVLDSSYATNKINTFKKESSAQFSKTLENKTKEDIKKLDDSDIYFDVIDANYSDLSSYLTYAPKADKYMGKTIRVRGFAVKDFDLLPTGYFAIGKYEISCCAADSEFVGFIAKTEEKIVQDNWYEIEGVLEKGKDSEGYEMMYINVTKITEISNKNEDTYIYPCYSYDDGSCKEVVKYNLEY